MSKRSPIIVAAYITAAATIIVAIILVVFPIVFSKSGKSTSVHESAEVLPDSVRVSGEPVDGTATQPDESKEQIISTPEFSEAIKDETFSPITLDQFYETYRDDSLTDLQKEDFVKKQMNRRFIWEGLIRTVKESSLGGGVTIIIKSKMDDWNIAICMFGKDHQQDLLSLKLKQHIRLAGILRYLEVEPPFLYECKLLEILD